MKKIIAFITAPKTLLIVIYLMLAQKLLLAGEFQYFRNTEQSYIHEYGTKISKGLVYLAFALSFLYPLIIWLQTKNNFRKHLTIVIIGSIPALYFGILYMLSS
ncbi:MAG: hypothetical protein COB98_09635 [Flavobacteriaceae bacterium]|nr:MAG: hypothetical protein COB98_09635 [Flavobacteriaceae bacterium]